MTTGLTLKDASLEVLHHYDAIPSALCSAHTVAQLAKRTNAVVWCNSNRDRKILRLEVNKRSTTMALFRESAKELTDSDKQDALEVYTEHEVAGQFAAVGFLIQGADRAWVVWRLEDGIYKVHGLFTIGKKHGELGWTGDAKQFDGKVIDLKFGPAKEVKAKPVSSGKVEKKKSEKVEKKEKKPVVKKKQPQETAAGDVAKPRSRADRAAARAAA